ncbi:MAG: hypothetical protein IJD83_05925 [Clostridia bacterium]|nr:hypothetical protein [Clostridia bacterium]
MKCCFIGHRDSFGLEKQIYTAIKKLIGEGCTTFYSGGMGNFDQTCERAVKQLRGKLVFVPYNHKVVKQSDMQWYDEIVCPFGNKAYENTDIPMRNRWLVDQCDVCLCYVYKNGGAKQTMLYANHIGKRIIYISK